MLLNAYNIHTLTHTHTHTHTHRRAGNAGFAHMLLNATASRAVTHNHIIKDVAASREGRG
jgi:hypothetical protein